MVTTTLMGKGAWSNASLVQAALCGAVFPPKWTRAASPNPLVNHYRASDGSRFLFCLLDPERDWARLCAAMERPDLVDDARFASVEARRDNHRECVAVLDDEFARRPMQEWARRFDANDVLFGPVPATADVAADNQIRINGGFTPMADAPFETVTSPVRVEGLDKRRPTMPPRVGQHTRGVLGELGYSEGEIVELESSKAVLHAD
jgi:crotonobetainyl-CoA:carnitine CoA-transferase CaiB-like acyl-CoA transferase